MLRENPQVVHTGKYIIREDGADKWYHGSAFEYGAIRSEGPLMEFIPDASPRYEATFFTASRQFARTYAESGIPRGYDFGVMYTVKIKDVPLFDVDDIFVDVNMPNSPLTHEGEVFWNEMLKHLPRKSIFRRHKMGEIMGSLQSGSYTVFDPAHKLVYTSFMKALRKLGYRGWVEREAGVLNIALLYPHEDAVILDSYKVGGARHNSAETSIYVYDVGRVPYQAPLTLKIESPKELANMRKSLLARIDDPEFEDTAANVLRDNRGSDEYDDLESLAEGRIDYVVIQQAGGGADLYVAVRSKDCFRQFVGHMMDNYAMDMYVAQGDGSYVTVYGRTGKFLYHNPTLY